MAFETDNLILVKCDIDILQSAIAGDDHLAKKLNVTVQDNWTEFGVSALQYSLERLLENQEENGWWTYFPVFKRVSGDFGHHRLKEVG